MISGRTLPLLQDRPEVDAWALWEVEYRDVVVVGPDGFRTHVVNLSDYTLADDRHLDDFESLLREVAARD